MTSPGHTNPAEGTTTSGQEQPSAMATPPTIPDPAGQTTPPNTGQPPATPPAYEPPKTDDGDNGDAGKTFTQADLDRLINERIQRERKTFEDRQAEQNKKLAQALGLAEDDADTVDPAKALEEAQTTAAKAQERADHAEAKVLAAAAGIKPERVAAFVKLCDISGALKDVDRTDAKAVEAALQAAVKQGVEEYPEFVGTTLPASSGSDRAGSQPQSVTVEQFKKMDVDERTKLYQEQPGLYRQLREQERG